MLREVFIWRSTEGLAAFGDKSFRDMENLVALDAGIGDFNNRITFKQLHTEGRKQAVVPDFPFTGSRSLRLVSQHAVDVLGREIFEHSGYLLPCNVIGCEDNFLLFKCNLKPDCLAEEAHFDVLYARFAFIPERIPVGVPFIGENNGRRYLFVDSKFKTEVEQAELSGIRFELVWSSDTGGKEYQLKEGNLVLV